MALHHNILLESGTNEFEIVEFIVAFDKPYHFCINVAKVQEVIRFPDIVHVPDVHPAIVGTANIRNNLVPVIDLGHWLGRTKTGDFEQSKVIVTYFNHMGNGFIVDEVVRIHRITWTDIKDYSALTNFEGMEAVLGVVNIQGRMIQMLDFESIIGDISPDTRLSMASVDMSLADHRRNYSVFLAEDSPVMRKVLVQSLSRAGYKVRAFENGAYLLEALKNDMPDVVITDLEMPSMGGDYLVAKIRDRYNADRLPVIVFSSMANDAMERKLLQVGANRFIGKPDLSLLFEIVDDYLLKG